MMLHEISAWSIGDICIIKLRPAAAIFRCCAAQRIGNGR